MSAPPMNYPALNLKNLTRVYRYGLLEDTLPFWTRHAVDHECGGFLTALDRKGAVIDTDKSMWVHGRFVWLLSTLTAKVGPREEWLDLARHGIDFMRKHGFDSDGRMFFKVTREGRPLRKRRYLFTEAFAAVGLAAYARATGDEQAAQEARDLFRLIIRYHTTPGLLEPKSVPNTRPTKGLGMPMILIATAHTLRRMDRADPFYAEWIDRAIEEIRSDFMHEEFEAVLENVGPKGEFIDTFDGRLLTPGHAIEAAWFILREAKYRGGDSELLDIGLKMLDWSWNWGWDEEYGGILYYRDARGLPSSEYWHDMKFWWPQNEAMIATLLAYQLTRDGKYARWHMQAHDWAYKRFPDQEHGEWFGYLHRDGSLSTTLKGNLWKGPFHLPRMQLHCWRLCEEMRAKQL